MAFWRLCPISLSLAQSYLQCPLPGLRHGTGSSPGPVPGPAPLRTAPSSAGTGRAVPRTGPQRGSTPSPRAKSLPNGSNIAFHFPVPSSAEGVIGAWCFRVVWVPAWCWGLTSTGRPHTWDSWREVLQRVSLLLLLPAPPNICRQRRMQQWSQAAAMPSRQLLLACRHPAQRDPGLEGKEASSSRSWCLLLQLKQQPERSRAAAMLVLGLKSASCKGCS